MELRAKDGFDAVNAYRPRTTPGVYVQTMPAVAWEFAEMLPFVMTGPAQFLPLPPIALTGEQWAKDYNEIKDVGSKNSAIRTTRQTEDEENALSRVLIGFHFRDATAQGTAYGRKIGERAASLLPPVK